MFACCFLLIIFASQIYNFMVYTKNYQKVYGYFKTMSTSKKRYSFKWLSEETKISRTQISFDFNSIRLTDINKDDYNVRMTLYIKEINKLVKAFNKKGNDLPYLELKNFIA